MQSEEFYLSEVEKSRAMTEMNERMKKKRKIEEVLYPAELVELLKIKDDQIKSLENENAKMLAKLAEGRRLMLEMKQKLGNDFL